MNTERESALRALLQRAGAPVVDIRLIDTALTHSSYANDQHVEHNERLEFLGDAVLELLVSEYLYQAYANHSEGELTRWRASLVCEPTLAGIARKLGVGQVLRLGKSQLATGGRDRPSLLADAVEAILGAVYLSADLEGARVTFRQLFSEAMADLEQGKLAQDYKTRLQEYLQKHYVDDSFSYHVVSEKGPDHNKTFFVHLLQNGQVRGRGSGRSKKEAEQAAAQEALDYFLTQKAGKR